MAETENTPPSDNPLLSKPLDQIPEEWREHARELRRENASLRERAKATDDAAIEAKIAAAREDAKKAAEDGANKTAERLIAKERDNSNRRIIAAELRSAAKAEGIVDLDALKLIDTSSLTVSDDGEVTGIDELIAEAKKAKPYLFAARSSSSTDAKPVPVKRDQRLNNDEADAALRRFGIH